MLLIVTNEAKKITRFLTKYNIHDGYKQGVKCD